MPDLAVIILAKNEMLHIRRCLEKLVPLGPRQVFIVDCFSTDGTQGIVEKFRGGGSNSKLETSNFQLELIEHEWPGVYAKQFNWALDNLPIAAKWVLRMDADEYLTPETIERLKKEFPNIPQDVSGLNIELKRKFRGGEIRHGTVGIRQARIFRYGIGRCEDRAMDEHIVVSEGRIIDFDGAFYDDSLMPFEVWKEKHRGYSKREARDAISLFNNPERLKNPSPTDRKKMKYYQMPPYLRAVLYFGIRYFLKLGFLDGLAGFRWHFWQGLWYRWIVDREIGRMKGGTTIVA